MPKRYFIFGGGNECCVEDNIVKVEYDTDKEMQAFIDGVEGAVGWEGYYVLDTFKEAVKFCDWVQSGDNPLRRAILARLKEIEEEQGEEPCRENYD